MIKLPFKIRKFLGISLALGYIICFFAFWQIPDHRLRVSFLDVGQGDAIFIKTPDNHQILIDGGPENFVMEELGNIMPFFDKTIDFMVLTHPHADHLEGLVEVLSRFDVENVLISGVNYDNPSYTEFLSILSSNSVNVFIAESGVDFKFGDVFLDVLYPFYSISGEKFENINNSSIVIKLNYKENKILFTGDLEEEFEEKLVLSGVDLSTDILKAGHHGSRTASSPAFLNACKPETVVIEVGEENSYEHPHAETLRNYFRAGIEKIYRTDLDGRVDFYF